METEGPALEMAEAATLATPATAHHHNHVTFDNRIKNLQTELPSFNSNSKQQQPPPNRRNLNDVVKPRSVQITYLR